MLVVIFSISCLGMVWADNNTTNATETPETEDTTSYIMPISITNNGIKFSDGFTGFCLDLTKNSITTDDKFTSEPATDSENTIKLAIIECYKANMENEIENIISKVINKDTNDDIAKKVLSSHENIGDSAVVEINNDTEATFNFELLKSSAEEKSDCLAYKVSLKTVKHEDTLSAVNDENETVNNTDNDTNTSGNKTDNENTETVQNNTKTNTIINNENNTAIINKTNTITINENNTTIINQNNTKIINKTNETPQNATMQDRILRTVGNPIFILVIVIIIIAIVAVTMHRKD